MEKFWKLALTVGGLASVGAFVFWSLYKQWLSLPIFSQLSPEQTYGVMKIFLWLTFASLIFLGGAYLLRSKATSPVNTDNIFKLHESWRGVNEIACERLIGPDVTNAIRAMTITSSSWLNGLVEKKVICQNHYEDFKLIYDALEHCDKIVPGFEQRGLKCKDFLSDEMKETYKQLLIYKGVTNHDAR